MQSNKFFATERPLKLFFLVAFPGMLSMLSASLYSIIEGVFIGQLLGEAAFAAVNIAMPFVMINFSLADLIGVGSSVQISIALGKKDYDKANNYFTSSIVLIFLAAFAMGLLLYTASPFLVKLMGAKGELAELAVRYVRVYAIMGPVTTIVFAMDNYLRISGFVKGSMFLNIFMSCLTAGLVYLFLGVLGMNVDGSALASAISMALCAVIALIPFVLNKSVLKLVIPHISLKMIKEIIQCGAPVFLNNIAGRVASILMNTALLRAGGEEFGQTAVAAYSVLMYAGEVTQFLLYGMSDSVQPAIGYNWGAKSLKRVSGIAKCSFFACGIVSLIGTAAMMLFPAQITSLFVKPEETALLEMATHAMRLFATAYLFRWVGFTVQGFFSAIEKPLPASILSISSAMVFPIFFIFALAPLGLDGLWLNLSASSLAVMIMALVMLRLTQKNMKNDIAESPDIIEA